jgi:hypothetical protein
MPVFSTPPRGMRGFRRGDRVEHAMNGPGTVVNTDANRVEVEYDHAERAIYDEGWFRLFADKLRRVADRG